MQSASITVAQRRVLDSTMAYREAGSRGAPMALIERLR